MAAPPACAAVRCCLPSPRPAEVQPLGGEAYYELPRPEPPPPQRPDFYAASLPAATTAPAPRPRPEPPKLSHPVSRLCDNLAEEPAEAKARAYLPPPSDDNNNNAPDATVALAQQQRPRNAAPTPVPVPAAAPAVPVAPADEHKCEQCSKTFVTRASLKVSSRVDEAWFFYLVR